MFAKLVHHNGLHYGLNYMKNCRTILYAYTSEAFVPDITFIRQTKDGIPTLFQDLIPIIRNKQKEQIQVVLSLLILGRLYTNVGVLDVKSIIQLPSSHYVDNITDSEIEDFVCSNKLILNEVSEPEFYIRTSVGPCGPAMTSIIQEAKSLPNDLYEIIVNGLPPDMVEVLDQCRKEECYSIQSFQQKDINSIRKITVVEDKEGKNRVIAIFDYWSQLVLKPLHKDLMILLKNLKQDCTFNQTGNVQTFLGNNKSDFYSLDLKNATDRFP